MADDHLDSLAVTLAGVLATMNDEDGSPTPGTILAAAVGGDAGALRTYTSEMFGISETEADEVLVRFSVLVELAADVAEYQEGG